MEIPREKNAAVTIGDKTVKLTNLHKPFWPDLGITKRDLLQYYADVSQWLLPHISERAMVMKRYANGAYGDFFFQKRAPSARPEWLPICAMKHSSGNMIDYPVIDDLPSLLWVVNLGCIDLNQWYAKCDDVDRPDYLHFDLDPVPTAGFECVLETALLVKEALDGLKIACGLFPVSARGLQFVGESAALHGVLLEQLFQHGIVDGVGSTTEALLRVSADCNHACYGSVPQ